MPAANGTFKANGRVSPMDEDTIKRTGKQEINTTNITVQGDPVGPTGEIIKKDIINGTLQKEIEEKEVEGKKKPEGRKLKSFEIVCIISINKTFLFTLFLV
jgi:hypothetical protein